METSPGLVRQIPIAFPEDNSDQYFVMKSMIVCWFPTRFIITIVCCRKQSFKDYYLNMDRRRMSTLSLLHRARKVFKASLLPMSILAFVRTRQYQSLLSFRVSINWETGGRKGSRSLNFAVVVRGCTFKDTSSPTLRADGRSGTMAAKQEERDTEYSYRRKDLALEPRDTVNTSGPLP